MTLAAFQNRLKKASRIRKSWASKIESSAFRLYEKDIPDYPYAIDRYGDFAVIYDLSFDDQAAAPDGKRPMDVIIEGVSSALKIPIEQIIYKRRKRMKGADQYTKHSEEKQLVTVYEGPALFEVNLTSYLDTGLFLDHRPLRKTVFQQAKQKRFLNLFSYTGSFSVMAALGGARCTSVDLSSGYQSWAERNFVLNKLNTREHAFIVSDVGDYLAHSRQLFDLIVLDPPTFSNSKRTETVFDVQRDHEDYIHACVERLTPNGTLFFSTNHRRFKLNPALETYFNVEKLSPKTIPIDYRDQKAHQAWRIML